MWEGGNLIASLGSPSSGVVLSLFIKAIQGPREFRSECSKENTIVSGCNVSSQCQEVCDVKVIIVAYALFRTGRATKTQKILSRVSVFRDEIFPVVSAHMYS